MSAGAGELRAGYASVEITPPVGTDLTGFIAREGPCEGALDPLEARALVVEDDAGNRAALVTCDLIGLGRHMVARVRSRAALGAGVPEAAQLFNCSHTHAGPETGVLTTIGLPNPDYLMSLEERLADVVIRAARDLAPVRVRLASGDVPDGLVINRVYRKHGRPEAYDRRLTVVRLETPGGAPFATVVSFACHAVALGAGEQLASADYVGALRGTLEAQGTGPVLYVNGCGGDVNPASMDSRGRSASEALGRGLAAAAQPLWASAAPVNEPSGVAAAQEWVALPYGPLRSIEEAAALLKSGREKLAAHEPGSQRHRIAHITEVEYALRVLRLRYGNEVLPEAHAEVQALRLGPIAVVALPGEIFSSIGGAIRLASPISGGRTIVAGWSNDNVGYVPDREAYAVEPPDAYEVDLASRYYGHPAAWSPEAGDRLRDAALSALRKVAA
ncbi:MAG TPA: hypothetical protein VFN74_19995 [Chloroflexota bacterium]|nr:hypothetical protein [Chloroflexota bacterium]